jgi:putative phage-type endonuclease
MNKRTHVTWLLETYGQNDQRSAAWHTKRGQMLTASEIYKGLPDATPTQRHELILSKLVPREYHQGPGVRALVWGTHFEPIAKEIYCELQHNITIADTTCVPHPTVSFLGASPDGVILSNDDRHGKLIEIKCPISREFTENTAIPHAYVHQMQLQLECTGLDECDYVEMQFKDLSYTKYLDCKAPYKSFYAVHEVTGDVLYKDFRTDESYISWKTRVLGDRWDQYEITYWMLNNWRSALVKKQPGWLELYLPNLTRIWNEVEEYRKTGTLPQAPREKATLVI